jgi:branched-chain amino acid transport system permease protein
VVLGGLGSVAGTALGGLVLGLVQALGALVFGDGYRLFVGLVVFLVLLAVRPQGLFGRAAT